MEKLNNKMIGKNGYKMDSDLGGFTILKGKITHYNTETEMYYIDGDIENWETKNSFFTSKKKLLKHGPI